MPASDNPYKSFKGYHTWHTAWYLWWNTKLIPIQDMCRCWLGDVLGALQDNRPSASQGYHKFHGRYGRNGATYTCNYHDPYWLLSPWLWYAMTFNSQIVHWLVSSHEKINGHRELTVSSRWPQWSRLRGPMITAQSRLGQVTAQSRRGHSSVMARSQLSHVEVTAQSRRSWLNLG